MQRFHQIVLMVSVVACCWFAMQGVHEFGHVIGAVSTGGGVHRVVLHPLGISRTDVTPNPQPAIVVWLGPILGCLIPASIWWMMPRRWPVARTIATFFAGFCLIANGAYIAFGSFDRVGDCAVMLKHGSTIWMLLAFGAITIPLGLFAWHRLGSVKEFLTAPKRVDPLTAYSFLITLAVMVILQLAFSPV